jgi:two-component system OmpR family response regulator
VKLSGVSFIERETSNQAGFMATLNQVLFVDDEQDILDVIQMALEAEGIDVTISSEGHRTIELAQQVKPQLILLDVMMPGIDGTEVLKQLLADPATAAIPVVFITAKIRPPEVDFYCKLGAAGVIAKPFDPMGLPNQLTTIWTQYHEQRHR